MCCLQNSFAFVFSCPPTAAVDGVHSIPYVKRIEAHGFHPLSMRIRLEPPSGRAGLKPRPFFPEFPRAANPPEQLTHFVTVIVGCQGYFQKRSQKHRTLSEVSQVGGAVPGGGPGSPRFQPWPHLLGRERDCPDTAGDYTANPGLRPESMDPSFWGGRRGVGWSQRMESFVPL